MFGRFAPTPLPGRAFAELSVGEATMDWTAAEVAAAIAELVERARAQGD